MKTSKLPKTSRKSIFGLIILFSVQLQAVEMDGDYIKSFNQETEWVPTTSLYFELGGKFFPSLNVDFRKVENYAISIGAGLWIDNEEHEQLLLIPSVNGYYFFGNRKRIEVGGGIGPFLSTYKGFASFLIFGNIGYRYQKKGGLIFPCLFYTICRTAC